MGLEKGVTEIPDSEDEPMTSSPVEVTNHAQKSLGNQLGATQASTGVLQVGGRDHQVLGEHPDLTASKQDENLDQTPIDDSLTGIDASEEDQVANAQPPDPVLQLDADFRSIVPSEEQPHELVSATDLSNPSKQQAQADDTDSRPTQQTPTPREATGIKAGANLEESAASLTLISFGTREAPINNKLHGECHDSQMDSIKPSAATAGESKHDTTVKVQEADQDDRPQQQEAPPDLSGVEKGPRTNLLHANQTYALQDDRPRYTNKSTASLPSRADTSGKKEPVPLHSSSTRTPSQQEGNATGSRRVALEDAEPKPSVWPKPITVISR